MAKRMPIERTKNQSRKQNIFQDIKRLLVPFQNKLKICVPEMLPTPHRGYLMDVKIKVENSSVTKNKLHCDKKRKRLEQKVPI